MQPTITTKKGRKSLEPRREPYWQRIQNKQHLGYRKVKDSNGSWIARWTTPDRKRKYNAVGDDSHLTFDEAQKLALNWFRQMEGSANISFTLKECVDEYISHLGVTKSSKNSARDTRQRLYKHLTDELMATKVKDLTTSRLKSWRDALVKDSPDSEIVRKSKSSANRLMNNLKAALNQAFKNGIVSDDTQWRRLESFRGVEAARTLYLTDKQINKLLSNAEGAIKDIVTAGILTGSRIGGLADAQCKDHDYSQSTVLLFGKTSPRTVFLSDEGNNFFKKMCADKKPSDLIFTKDDGTSWGKSTHDRPFRKLVAKAKLPSETVFYSLRHYHISKALLSGMPPQVVAENCATSIRMLEKHYGKFMQADRRSMMNTVKLGITKDNE